MTRLRSAIRTLARELADVDVVTGASPNPRRTPGMPDLSTPVALAALAERHELSVHAYRRIRADRDRFAVALLRGDRFNGRVLLGVLDLAADFTAADVEALEDLGPAFGNAYTHNVGDALELEARRRLQRRDVTRDVADALVDAAVELELELPAIATQRLDTIDRHAGHGRRRRRPRR